MLFMAGVKTRAQLDAVAAAVKLPLFLGGAGAELYDLDYLSARNVRVCLQGHLPFMAAVNAVHETLKALRDGTPPADIKTVASPDLMKQVTRQADYAKWSKEFLDARPSAAAEQIGLRHIIMHMRGSLDFAAAPYRLQLGDLGEAPRAKEYPMPSVSDWKVPSSAQPKPEDYGYDLEQALSSVVGAARHRAGGRVHRGDARHRARRQRRLHSRQRLGPDHRLSDYRSRDDLDQRSTTAARCRAMCSATIRRPDSVWCRRWPSSTCRRSRSANRPRPRSASASWSAAPAGGSARSPPASSPSRNSPATGNMCSTKRSSPRPRIRTGAAPR